MPSQKGDFIPGEELGCSMSQPKRKKYLWGAAGGAWNCPKSEVDLLGCNLEVPGATLKGKLVGGMQLGHPRTVLKGE